jgi:ribosomal protein S18 acetylase RimI-like enzyme
MESTEVRLGLHQLAGCLALSESALWNQNGADWRLMLELGEGWGVVLADGTLAASTVVLPYEGRFAWVSMVLVLPGQRRKGYASQLLRLAIAHLQKRGLTPILDATPAGHEVYSQEGFRDTWGFQRFFLKNNLHIENSGAVREIRDSDWKSILQLDARAFGASRERLLRALARRLPQAALVAEKNGRLAGFLFGRDGREACQLGPLVAADAGAARALLAEGVRRVTPPVYVDVVDHAPEMRAWLEGRGFTLQRPFTRMVHGAPRAPGEEKSVYLVAGPELG